jgi:hypothetical protein
MSKSRGSTITSKNEIPAHLLKPLPMEVIRYWLEGSYSGGLAPSVTYDQLGWALMIRGFYHYEVRQFENAGYNKFSHRGYSIIDLKEGEIYGYGVRLCSGDQWGKIRDFEYPLLWKSEASAIRPSSTKSQATISCAYRLLVTETWSGASKIPTAFRSRAWKRKKIGPEIPVPQEQAIAIDYLVKDFESDWNRVNDTVKNSSKPQEGEFIGGFAVEAKVPASGAPVQLQGTFSTVGLSTVVAGQVTYTRIDAIA